jgi:hypothetical protein
MPRPARVGKVGIFYHSLEPKPGSQAIALPDGGTCYVRVEVVHSTLLGGLDAANPFPGENVMNAHPLEQDWPE